MTKLEIAGEQFLHCTVGEQYAGILTRLVEQPGNATTHEAELA